MNQRVELKLLELKEYQKMEKDDIQMKKVNFAQMYGSLLQKDIIIKLMAKL